MNKSEIPAGQKAVLSLLLDDHREAKKLFKAFEKADDEEEKERIARDVCTKLTAHTELEETLFYPYIRDQSPEKFGSLLNEALVEHASAKALIAELEKMSPDDEMFEAKVTVLGEYVNHHVEEEETELFPKIIRQHIDLTPIEQKLTERHASLLGSPA